MSHTTTVRDLNMNVGVNTTIACVVFLLAVAGKPLLAIAVTVGAYYGRKKGLI